MPEAAEVLVRLGRINDDTETLRAEAQYAARYALRQAYDACDQSWPPSYAIPGQPLPVSSRKPGTEPPTLFQRITLQPHAGEELT